MNNELFPAIPEGSLFPQLARCTSRALAEGALIPIETTHEVVMDQGIPFMVRVATNLKRKGKEKARSQLVTDARPFNPFLPPEPLLTLGALGPHHLGVLNKFNVVEHHLLMVTRHYEEQERLLNEADFAVLWRCLDEYPGLGFYNGGTIAGASQHHKHLQYVPLPLLACNCGSVTPIEPLLAGISGDAIQRLSELTFRHRICSLTGLDDAQRISRCLMIYRSMLDQLGCGVVHRDAGWWQGAPYNLLMTRDWMMVVPRTSELSHGVSINGMGFAGSLFVPEAERVAAIREVGPMAILMEVSGGSIPSPGAELTVTDR